MKANEFKKILRPLIKQTVKEVILEEGILSNIVAEVARGLSGNLVVESATNKEDADHQKEAEILEKKRQDRIRKLNESSKVGNAFSGTKEIKDKTNSGALSGISPSDSGVDISAIEKIANGKWKQLI
jgi:ribosomal 30S subunit maturation factor RimM